MRLQLMSDLHIKNWGTRMGVNWFQKDFVAETHTDADVLALCGDIVDLRSSDWRWSVARMQEFSARYRKVVYVPGNHEFYGTSIVDTVARLEELGQLTGIDVLWSGKKVVLEGHTFHGDTMWQPWSDDQPISDHYAIGDFEPEAGARYKLFREHLERELKKGDIVLSHHAPSWQSCSDEWRGHPCNRWFITPEIEPLILERQPAFWFHGHCHTSFDYKLGETRVLCNPMGYPDEGVRFNPKLILELGEQSSELISDGRNLPEVPTTCRYCFFQQMADGARARAEQWEEQKLSCLAGSHRKASRDFAALAEGEKVCRCGEPIQPRVSRSPKKVVQGDQLDPL